MSAEGGRAARTQFGRPLCEQGCDHWAHVGEPCCWSTCSCGAAPPSESEREVAEVRCGVCKRRQGKSKGGYLTRERVWLCGEKCYAAHRAAPPSPPSTGQPKDAEPCDLCWGDNAPERGGCPKCAPVAPSTGQSREQRLEEALREMAGMNDARAMRALARRALESKP